MSSPTPSPAQDVEELVRAAGFAYRSRFDRWDERASVRSSPAPQLEQPPRLALFPRRLFPVVDHPVVTARGGDVADRLLTQRLHIFLEFTVELELSVVNPICAQASRRRLGFDLPARMAADAFAIYTDEAWHAQTSSCVSRQVAARTGVQPVELGSHAFSRRLAAQRHAAPELARLLTLSAAIVSESLISAILTDLPRDPTVSPAVRGLVAEHAADEGIHRAYFTQLLECIWSQLDQRSRTQLAQCLPPMFAAFLSPDLEATATLLFDAGLTANEVATVVSDVHTQTRTTREIHHASRSAIESFRRVGVLDQPGAVEAFAAGGLVGPTLTANPLIQERHEP